MKPVKKTRLVRTVLRYPKRSETIPLMNRPMISPTAAPLLRPDFHAAVTSYFPPPMGSPNFSLNRWNAKKLLNRQTS